MMLLEDGTVESDSEQEVEDEEKMPVLLADEEKDYVCDEGLNLITLRVLNTLVKEDDPREQRTNIFYTKYKIMNRVCLMIIDSGSCTNLASSYFVDKLRLKTTNHPHPYKLTWMNDCGKSR